MTPIKADVVIIGSGISALTCATLLSANGKSVIVLEQAAKPGGYMHSFKRFGELFDTGAHYVGAMGPGQPFDKLLRYLGVYHENLFVPLDPTGFDVLKFPEGDIEIPQGYENVIRHFSSFFPGERAAIEKYFSLVQQVVKYFATYEFTDETIITVPPEAFEKSLAEIVEGLTSNKRLQSVLYAYCNLHGVSPQEVAFGFHGIVTDSLIRGPYGLLEGGDSLTQAFIKKIEAGGGKVLTKRRVTSLKVDDRIIKEVVTENGEVYQADWVISSIHPKQTFNLLTDNSFFTPAFTSRVKNLTESIGIFGVYAVAPTKPQQLAPLKNYYFFRTSDPQELFQMRESYQEPSVVFMSCPKRDWDDVGGKYPVSLHAASPAPWFSKWEGEKYGKRSEDYKVFKEQFTQQVFSLVDRYIDGMSANFDQYVTSSPLTNLHFNGTEEGSSYGIYHSIQNTGPRAIGPRTKVLNLLLTGQNSLFPGLMGAAVSALRTSGHIIGIKGILSDLKNLGVGQ